MAGFEDISNKGMGLPSSFILLATAVVILATFAATQLGGLIKTKFSGERKVYDIIELRVYPVKSCRGISLRKTHMQMHGLDLDRQWMFVDGQTHQFVTIRQNPRMTLINTKISEDGKNLILSVGDEQVSVAAYPTLEWLAANTTLEHVKIWSDDTDGYMYGPEVNEHFSRFLDQDVRLVYKGPSDRILSTNAKPELLGRSQSTYFPDQMPLLIASDASVTELNERLAGKGERAITIERFRPNIIIRGNQAWSEDRKKEQKPIIIDVVARCARCQVPNVEPTTAEKHKREPWDTLMSYRRVDKGSKYKPCFGMHSVPRNEGEIEIGMQLEVLKETDKHRIVH
ncbi:MOSC domain protein [Talaromyces stipitatus ATCC 10500]|uniref:MOSC domain protein n=1 Tax=Talaromyces stipitatus (strain ATCC 10500 / CBS 375.48 / QM 6759 / NRRL 1006) TaxID=441959 RepID=B8LZH8_TALSN|nr:MOSC domain protein [Talaromyces stipitatus ATCC 10500]EED22060.1 MOSC domain protein [Talaromyces stipitatus ATCC 10500]